MEKYATSGSLDSGFARPTRLELTALMASAILK